MNVNPVIRAVIKIDSKFHISAVRFNLHYIHTHQHFNSGF